MWSKDLVFAKNEIQLRRMNLWVRELIRDGNMTILFECEAAIIFTIFQ